jgi:hypothetical protein
VQIKREDGRMQNVAIESNPPLKTDVSQIKIYPSVFGVLDALWPPFITTAFFGVLVALFFLSGPPRTGLFWLAIGSAPFLLLGLVMLIIELYRACTFGAHVVIDEKGIWDRRGTVGLIPWNAIYRITHDEFFNEIAVYSSMTGGEIWLVKQLNKIEAYRDWEGDLGTEGLCIKFKTLSKTLDKVWPAIVEHTQKHGLRCEGKGCRRPNAYK